MRRYATKVAVCVLAVLALGHFMPCQAIEAPKQPKKLWWASVAAVVAASLLDVASSQGGKEANPLLQGPNGTFSTGRALLLKSVASGGIIGIEAWVLHRSPSSARSASVVNFATAGTISALAVRNWRVASAPATQ